MPDITIQPRSEQDHQVGGVPFVPPPAVLDVYRHHCNQPTRFAVIASVATELSADVNGEVQILPAGTFTCLDGRGPFELTDAVGAKIVAWFESFENDLAIDYEHQRLNAESNGQPAPAAGWIKRLEWRAGVGLFAQVEWTARAHELIKAREYKYLSPVFYTDKKQGGKLLPMIGVPGLVIDPAIDGMAPATAASQTTNASGATTMDLAQLIALLGLPEGATEADVKAAIEKLKTPASAAASAASVDMSQYVPVAAVQELQTKVAELSAASSQREVNELVAAAVAEGKLHTPQLQAWAATQKPEALKAFLASCTAIPALAGQMQSQQVPPAAQGATALTDAEREVCARIGLSPEQFAAAKAA